MLSFSISLKLSLFLSLIYSLSLLSGFFFSGRVFFHNPWWFTGQQVKGGDHFLFYSGTSTLLRTFRHLFATLHVRRLSRIFNRTACIYQIATRWDLPPYWITIWLIGDAMLFFVSLLDDLILGSCYSNLTRETSGSEVSSTITLAFQSNRLTKYVRHPKIT